MRWLFDTSVLVAAMVAAHPHHERARPWLTRAKQRDLELVLYSHTLAELYAVLTTLPLSPRMAPHTAIRLIDANAQQSARRVVALTPTECGRALRRLADADVRGGATYDALTIVAAEKAKAERILTLNRKDFVRLWPERAGDVVAP